VKPFSFIPFCRKRLLKPVEKLCQTGLKRKRDALIHDPGPFLGNETCCSWAWSRVVETTSPAHKVLLTDVSLAALLILFFSFSPAQETSQNLAYEATTSF
jgi:hypothetical protein